jgi:hypothetical protein
MGHLLKKIGSYDNASLLFLQPTGIRDKQRQALREFFSSACGISARFCIQQMNYTEMGERVKRFK